MSEDAARFIKMETFNWTTDTEFAGEKHSSVRCIMFFSVYMRVYIYLLYMHGALRLF